MKLKQSKGLNFSIKNISTLWRSKIPNLGALQAILPGSVLVAFDLESSARGVGEIGLAFLRVSGQMPHFSVGGGMRSFYVENEVRAHSIQIRDGIRKSALRETTFFGETVLVDIQEAGSTAKEILSNYGSGLILVGFDLRNELKWISQECPSLASSFAA